MARNTKFDLPRFHFEHTLWLNEVNFVGHEVDIFARLLQEMKVILPTESENHFAEILKSFEHQLGHFKRTAADIRSEIHAQEVVMASTIREEMTNFNEDIWETQLFLREKMEFFHDNYRKLKTEFRLFVGKDLESHFEVIPKGE